MSKHYEIRTVQDLVNAARESGDIDTLAADIKGWLTIAIELDVKLINPALTFDDTKFIWVDDGDSGVSGINVSIDKEQKQ